MMLIVPLKIKLHALTTNMLLVNKPRHDTLALRQFWCTREGLLPAMLGISSK